MYFLVNGLWSIVVILQICFSSLVMCGDGNASDLEICGLGPNVKSKLGGRGRAELDGSLNFSGTHIIPTGFNFHGTG